MAISAFNGQAQDLQGNAVTAFQVEVRNETSGLLAVIYSDFAGLTPLGNPFAPNPSDNGHFRFYADQGRYRIRVFDGSGDVADWRDVTVGFDDTNLLEEDQNLADVAAPTTAFDNIKQPATTSATGVVEEATDAEVYASTDAKFLDAGHLSSAAAMVSLTDAATVSWDWTDGINFSLTVAGNRTIGSPSNPVVGQWRCILVQGSDTTDRTLSFHSDFTGDIPTLTDIDNTHYYLLMIFCRQAGGTPRFSVSAKNVRDA